MNHLTTRSLVAAMTVTASAFRGRTDLRVDHPSLVG